MLQDVLALATVALAAAYVIGKLVVLPALAKRGPDVPVSRLVRKRGRKGPADDCCGG